MQWLDQPIHNGTRGGTLRSKSLHVLQSIMPNSEKGGSDKEGKMIGDDI